MRIALAVALALGVASIVVADPSHAAVRRPTNIPAQSLGPALKEFAASRDLQVLYFAETVRNLRTGGAAGDITIDEALTGILDGTGLTYKYLDDKTVTIVPVAAPPTTSASEANRMTLEEVVVTAQKRMQRAIDVPISIVALGGEELTRRKVLNIDDLMAVVPGLAVQNAGYQRRIMLRGISNTFGNSLGSLIGLYIDEASATSGAFAQLDLRTYDLERVEVLRGPQGTLYGEGSVGGTIRFITREPDLNDREMRTDVAALFTETGDPGQRAEAMLNVPLIENELGLRIAGTYDHQGGWIDQPAAGVENFNDQSLKDVRVKGLWKPTERFALNAMAIVHRNDAPFNVGEDEEGDYAQTFNLTTTPQVVDDYDLYNLTLSYDFARIRILSTSSYIEQEKSVQNAGFLNPSTPPGTPLFNSLVLEQQIGTNVFTQELRLTSSGEGPWQWTLGGFYRDAELDFSNRSLGSFTPTLLPAPRLAVNTTQAESSAVFGDASYQFTPRVTLGAGLRYFEDKVHFASAAGPALSLPALVAQQGTFHSLNPRLYAQYQVSDRVNTYASAAKGFRSGGFNQLNVPTFDPEDVWTYELGVKTLHAEGRFGADVALFYSDYKDYQIVGLVPGTPFTSHVSNAGNALIRGIEWSLSWKGGGGWSAGFGGNYLDSEFYEIKATNSTHAVGDPLDLSPKYAFTLSGQRDFNWSDKPGYVRVDYSRTGRSVTRMRNTGPWYYSESDLIDAVNMSTSLQWSPRVAFNLFALNLLNERGYVDAFSIGRNAARMRPRTVGIGFTLEFE
jgi:iron complex outermembrane recepter protein